MIDAIASHYIVQYVHQFIMHNIPGQYLGLLYILLNSFVIWFDHWLAAKPTRTLFGKTYDLTKINASWQFIKGIITGTIKQLPRDGNGQSTTGSPGNSGTSAGAKDSGNVSGVQGADSGPGISPK